MSANEMKHLILILTIFVITTLHTISGDILSKFYKYEVKGDGSCLFSAIQYAIWPGEDVVDESNIGLRRIVGEQVKANPELYEAALIDLEKTAEEYPDFIANTNAWGGEIDIRALSDKYSYEIAVVNLTSKTVIIYGEFPWRIYLLYDSDHYSALYKMYLTFEEDKSSIETKFLKSDTATYEEAKKLAEKGSPWKE